MRRFVTYQNNASKFWEVDVSDNELITRSGRLGMPGQTRRKPLSDPARTLIAQQKLIEEKLRDGYVEVSSELAPEARINELLKQIHVVHGEWLTQPRVKQCMSNMEELKIHIAPAEPAEFLETFDTRIRRTISPMLKARFNYGGTIKVSGELWLSADEIHRWLMDEDTNLYYRSLQADWEKSAPMRFSADRVTLFSVTEDVPDSVTYLVWVTDVDEPEVWTYVGWNEGRYKDLATFLEWKIINMRRDFAHTD